MAKRKVALRWSATARKQFKSILLNLNNESPFGAKIVLDTILDRVAQLPRHPEMYPADKLREDQDNSFRAFTVFSYRITYRITTSAIIVYRIRHSSREPQLF